ncbi:MAG: hypothetical protein ACRDNL_23925, partial [Spirillospora sp.]
GAAARVGVVGWGSVFCGVLGCWCRGGDGVVTESAPQVDGTVRWGRTADYHRGVVREMDARRPRTAGPVVDGAAPDGAWSDTA